MHIRVGIKTKLWRQTTNQKWESSFKTMATWVFEFTSDN